MNNLIDQNKKKITDVLKKMADFMNLDFQVEVKEENKEGRALLVSIYTPENAKFLIGKNGQNLKALEHLMRFVASKDVRNMDDTFKVLVDVNDYKKSRASMVIDLAKKAVTRVRNTQKAEALAPMSSYERRVVHMELASYPDIATESIGDEPQRRVVIKPYP